MNEQQSLTAAIHEAVRLQAYDFSWPAAYAAERERLLLMARKLMRFMTILMVPAMGLGLWLWLDYGIGRGQG